MQAFVVLQLLWRVLGWVLAGELQRTMFIMLMPWLGKLVLCDAYFLLGVAMKHLVIGEFVEGPRCAAMLLQAVLSRDVEPCHLSERCRRES